MKTHIWLRCETKESERRTALTPKNAKELIEAGAEVTVESDINRIFPDSDYEQIGANLVKSHCWKEVSPSENLFILGLKEILEEDHIFKHQHIYFAHVYKGQEGHEKILSRYKQGGGKLYDLEYLTNTDGRRIAAFGYWAGFAGAAFALDRFFQKQSNEPYPGLKSFESIDALLTQINFHKEQAPRKSFSSIIIGAKGRCGSGAIDLFEKFNGEITKWDMEETKKGGPFKEILDHDIFLNAVLMNIKIPPFIDKATLDKNEGSLSLIADVSCDPNSELNPIPLYDEHTSWSIPFTKVGSLEIMGVDNLPSTLPRESSEDFSDQLLPHLKDLVTKKGSLPLPFQNALAVFNDKIKLV